jgi:hypothetical protein
LNSRRVATSGPPFFWKKHQDFDVVDFLAATPRVQISGCFFPSFGYNARASFSADWQKQQKSSDSNHFAFLWRLEQ